VHVNKFKDHHILGLQDMTRGEIELVFKVAGDMEPYVDKRIKTDLARDKILATLFFQPSTRTRLSFEAAMQRLGGSVLGFASPEVSRAGDETAESLADTARVVNHYADLVVMRHTKFGAVAEYANWSTIPVLNGGDGYAKRAEHPTQGLLDLYTIKKEFGKIDGLKIGISGDLNTRSKHSSLYGLSKFKDITIYFYPLADKPTEAEFAEDLRNLTLKVIEVPSMEEMLSECDVFFPGWASTPGKTTPPSDFILTPEKLNHARKHMIVMHQLPRLGELPPEIDSTPHARYFEEARNGVPIRMALIALVLGLVN
jgi:aspartate carbamoyltransferase catalytic subunit